MPEPIETVIDHAADLQRQVDRLCAQVAALGVAVIALALAVLIMELKLWRR